MWRLIVLRAARYSLRLDKITERTLRRKNHTPCCLKSSLVYDPCVPHQYRTRLRARAGAGGAGGGYTKTDTLSLSARARARVRVWLFVQFKLTAAGCRA